MKISSVDEMRRMDRTAMEKYGIRDEILMENAGQAVYFVLLNEFGIKNKKFVVFCGAGNNGGDGFVIARKIHSNGGEVKVFVLGNTDNFKGAAKINFDIVSNLSIRMKKVESIGQIEGDISCCDAVVDAIFGTGLAREIVGLYRDVIELVNRSGKTIFGVDIPSGVNGDTGEVMGVAVRADYTVTFGLPKMGNMLFPGYELCGKLYVSHISFPPSLYGDNSIKVEINCPPVLPKKNKSAHKGNFGQVLFVAGAAGYFGAPYFSAMSFLKAGGGYSRLAAPKSITPFIANKGSEIVFIPQKETGAGSIAHKNMDALLELSKKMDMIVIGPGLSLDEETRKLVRDIVKNIEIPVLIDGDGITALCEDLQIIKDRRFPTVLTPHTGEMSRLTGIGVGEINARKADTLRRASNELNAIVVLKGAHSLIGYPDGRIFVNMSGNSGMATAGSGDVLTGTIAAMFGLGLSFEDSVRKGVFVHGLSGDLAALDKGEDGITAHDILDYLPAALKADREGLNKTLRERYRGARVI